jgi:hypothetical protein
LFIVSGLLKYTSLISKRELPLLCLPLRIKKQTSSNVVKLKGGHKIQTSLLYVGFLQNEHISPEPKTVPITETSESNQLKQL